jgi:hypothetical protein
VVSGLRNALVTMCESARPPSDENGAVLRCFSREELVHGLLDRSKLLMRKALARRVNP